MQLCTYMQWIYTGWRSSFICREYVRLLQQEKLLGPMCSKDSTHGANKSILNTIASSGGDTNRSLSF